MNEAMQPVAPVTRGDALQVRSHDVALADAEAATAAAAENDCRAGGGMNLGAASEDQRDDEYRGYEAQRPRGHGGAFQDRTYKGFFSHHLREMAHLPPPIIPDRSGTKTHK